MTWQLVHIGNGQRSHATGVAPARTDITFCGRSTKNASDWLGEGGEPGCQPCYDRSRRQLTITHEMHPTPRWTVERA